MKIEQVDRDAAADGSPCVLGFRAIIRAGKMDDNPVVQAFARHRIQAREQAMNDALTALKSVQYSPAPYTDGVKAIRARFL